jgi:hypothetical protein
MIQKVGSPGADSPMPRAMARFNLNFHVNGKVAVGFGHDRNEGS